MKFSRNSFVVSVMFVLLVASGAFAAYYFQPIYNNPNITDSYALSGTMVIYNAPSVSQIESTYLFSADKNNTLETFEPMDLVALKSFPGFYLRSEAADALEAMYQAAVVDGVYLDVISAYRSYYTQSNLFNTYANTYGREEANTFSALPGQSEHQLGTTVDFGNNSSRDLTRSFEDTAQSQWLSENAIHYGFVLSYPDGMSETTGYIYEPWHYRYIGVHHAYDYRESGLTLNQYLATIRE